jgi:hypothetical protein
MQDAQETKHKKKKKIVLECWGFHNRLVSRTTDMTCHFVDCRLSESDCVKLLEEQ